MIVVFMALTFALLKAIELFEKESIVLLYGLTSTVPLLLDNENFEYQNPMYEGRSRRDGCNGDRNASDNNSKPHYNIANFGSPGNGEETDGGSGGGGGENKEGIDDTFEEKNPMYPLEGSPKTPQSRKVNITTAVSKSAFAHMTTVLTVVPIHLITIVFTLFEHSFLYLLLYFLYLIL
jgi:hypothetical protein